MLSIFTVCRVVVAMPVTSQNEPHTRKKAPVPLPRRKLSSLDSSTPPQNRPRPLPPPKPKLKKASSVDVALVPMQEMSSAVASIHGNRDGIDDSCQSHGRVQYMNLPPAEEKDACEVDRHEDSEMSHVSSEPSPGPVNTGHSRHYYNLSPIKGDMYTSESSPVPRPSTEEFLARILHSEEGGGEGEGERQAEESAPAGGSYKSQQGKSGEGKGTELHSERGQTQYSKRREHPVLGRAMSSDAVRHPALGQMWSSGSGSSDTDIHNDTRRVHMRTNEKPHMYYNLLLIDDAEDIHWQCREGGGKRGEGRKEGKRADRGEGEETGRGEREEYEGEHLSGSMDVRQFPSEWLGTKKRGGGQERGGGEVRGGGKETGGGE